MLEFPFNCSLIVNGTLLANGNTFTKSGAGSHWGGICFNSGSSSSSLSNCDVEYGIAGIYVDNSSPTIQSTNISNSAYYGIVLNGSANSSLYQCEVINNDVFGVVVGDNSSFDPVYCLISGNGYGGDATGGILNDGDSYIRYCTLSSNCGVGVYVNSSSWADIGEDAQDGEGNNNIGNNSSYEINSQIASEVPAYYNYWGDEDGPNPNDLNGNIGYNPWLEEDPGLPWGLDKAVPGQYAESELIMFREGIRQMQFGNWEIAGEKFREFVTLYPESYFSRFALNRYIYVMDKLNRTNDTEQLFTSLEKLNSSASVKDYLWGVKMDFYRKQGRFDEAVAIFNHSADIKNPDIQKSLWLKRIQIYCGMGDTSSAIAAYKNFIDAWPDDVRSRIAEMELTRLTGNSSKPIAKQTQFSIINALPETYSLGKNYPNPFNPATTIPFDLPEDSKVKITIFDLTGRLVMELINENRSAGYHTLQWDASNLPSGVYLYRMQAGNFSDMKKCLLVK